MGSRAAPGGWLSLGLFARCQQGGDVCGSHTPRSSRRSLASARARATIRGGADAGCSQPLVRQPARVAWPRRRDPGGARRRWRRPRVRVGALSKDARPSARSLRSPRAAGNEWADLFLLVCARRAARDATDRAEHRHTLRRCWRQLPRAKDVDRVASGSTATSMSTQSPTRTRPSTPTPSRRAASTSALPFGSRVDGGSSAAVSDDSCGCRRSSCIQRSSSGGRSFTSLARPIRRLHGSAPTMRTISRRTGARIRGYTSGSSTASMTLVMAFGMPAGMNRCIPFRGASLTRK